MRADVFSLMSKYIFLDIYIVMRLVESDTIQRYIVKKCS